MTIHPCVDGNGRTARLLMNLLLLMHGYPPAIIRPRDRVAYLGALETAQLGGSKTAYDNLVAGAVGRSLDIYLDAGATPTDRIVSAEEDERLLKIGQVTKAVGETVSTIRHWTKLGLLNVAQTARAGYQLFAAESIARCRRIQSLKGRRHTLAEIRTELS